MAFNIQTFKTRALTAIVFVAVMLVGLLWNHWSFFVLFSVIHFGCWIEYQKLVALIDPEYKTISSMHRNIVMLLGWSFMLFMMNDAYRIGHVTLHAVGWYAMMVLTIVFCVNEIVLKKNLNPKLIAHSVFGLMYISLSWGLMVGLRNEELIFKNDFLLTDNGWLVPVVLIASIWINDTMQYIVGSFIGKTPFSKISPKKTWEGTIGGSLLCIVVVGFLIAPMLASKYEASAHTKSYHWFVIAAIAAIIGTLGDLLESKLKRLAGVKDSGQLMPGHGGFLDRFDSLILATPFVWVFIKLFVG